MFISKKKLDLAMRSFKCATIISIEYSQPFDIKNLQTGDAASLSRMK